MLYFHVASYCRDSNDNPSSTLHAVNENGAPPLQVSIPTPSQHALLAFGVHVAYYIHCQQANPNVLPGSAVLKLDSLCSPFDPAETSNLFGHYFRVEFVHEGHT